MPAAFKTANKHMKLADIHIHALFGVDDGADTEEKMYEMVDASYRDGVRFLCVTPHYHPGFYGDNGADTDHAFALLKSYVAEHYPDLTLALGNELHYSASSVTWLKENLCHTMNESRYVLVDFSNDEAASTILDAMTKLLGLGYIPILAHAERYKKLSRNCTDLMELQTRGVIIQMDTQSLLGDFGRFELRRSYKMIKLGLVDIISTDAHGLSTRPPNLSSAYQLIKAHYGPRVADKLCYYNAVQLLTK